MAAIEWSRAYQKMFVVGTTKRGTGTERVFTFVTLEDLLDLYVSDEHFRTAFNAKLGEAIATDRTR